MSKVFIEETTLSSIGDAIREKAGTSELINPLDMANAIVNLPSGGDLDIPEDAFVFSGDCSYIFANEKWAWFLNAFGNKITTNNISNAEHMFNNTDTLEEIPFDINITDDGTITYIFSGCSNLKSVPNIIGPERAPMTSKYGDYVQISGMFGSCVNLREIPYDYFWKIVPNKDFWVSQASYGWANYNGFGAACSLRSLPDLSMFSGDVSTSTYNSFYAFSELYSLDEIVNLPVLGVYSSNAFGGMTRLYRIKDYIFETNEDGTPKTANWKKQTINLTEAGWGSVYYEKIYGYNSGITADKEVIDDATYQALKDDPDWFTGKIAYCRYNRNSAVNTINSLPDTSAYGTNTIKFKGEAGSATDGGAINTLTEEEIAVATAKGWTVSLV